MTLQVGLGLYINMYIDVYFNIIKVNVKINVAVVGCKWLPEYYFIAHLVQHRQTLLSG